MYCCNFDYRYKNKQEVNKARYASCFREIYNNIDKLDKLVVYVLKDYTNKGRNKLLLTKEEMIKFTKALNKMQMKVSMTEGQVDLKNMYDKDNKICDCYVFDIDVENNGIKATLILLNIIRHTYETLHTCERVVPFFMKLLNLRESAHTTFNKFLMSYITLDRHLVGGGHSFSINGAIHKLFKDKETYSSYITDRKNAVFVSTTIPHKYINEYEYKSLQSMYKSNKPFNELKAKYEELCN